MGARGGCVARGRAQQTNRGQTETADIAAGHRPEGGGGLGAAWSGGRWRWKAVNLLRARMPHPGLVFINLFLQETGRLMPAYHVLLAYGMVGLFCG